MNGPVTCFMAPASEALTPAKNPTPHSTPMTLKSWTPPSPQAATEMSLGATPLATTWPGTSEPLATFASFALSRGTFRSIAPSRISTALELLADVASSARVTSVTPTRTASWTAHSADRLTQYLRRGESLPLLLIAQVMNSWGR